ncbi:MAG: 4Fe-4S cluster-binding domain-containing protein [Deltaproteobacteria bacterium]|nr:4Fe-4S cluster-binding domain-containing protein [Deltaproteobacteria bacterium]
MGELINIHAILPYSRVNGPGLREVVFFQGCARDCEGCFNPDTHTFEARKLHTPWEVLEKRAGGVEGITVSGGEPFMQKDGLLLLLKQAKGLGLSTVVYTGFTLKELKSDRLAASILEYIDVLIDGPYIEERKEKTLLARGSENQRLIFLTDRYNESDFLMPGKVEVIIGRDGAVTETGFSRVIFGAGH